MNKLKRIISATLVGIMITPSIVSAYPVPQMEETNPINQSVQLRTPANNVEDGIYTAPVEVAHAYNEGQKSMANNAIEHTAKVVYRGDKVTIELTFKGMELFGMKGHLTNLFFYKDNKDPLNNNDVIEAEVIKRQLDLGLDGKKHNYPQIFRYTMDKSIFEASDFLWIKVWVDAMDALGLEPGEPITPGRGEQNAKIVIDKTNFTKVVLNTEELSKEIASAKEIVQGKKTDEAFNTLKAAITTAEKVLGEATEQSQLDESVKTLKAAVEAFNNSPNALEKEALTNEIAEAKKVEQGKKTDEAFNKLKAVIKAAEETLKTATDQEALNQGVATLKAAVEAFKASKDVKILVEDGIYTAPVEVAHAYNEGQKSMANNAIEHTGKVVYRGDKVTIELTFKGMELFGMKGHLTNLFFYKDNKDPLNNNDVIEAEVIKRQLDLGLDGKKHNYPQIFRYTMDKSVFEASDFLWIKVWVDAMDALGLEPREPITPGRGEQNAKIVIDKTNFTKVVLNTEALTKEIAEAKKVEQGKKTDEAFNTLKAAIKTAEKVLGEATEQSQLDEAVKILKEAVKAFNNSPDVLEKEALTKEIAEAKKIEQGKKTEEAYNSLKEAIKSAEKVLGEATEQTQLDEAVKTLKSAVKAFNESEDKVVPTPLQKEALTNEIAEAKKVEQGKKTEEAFNTLKAAIKTAEEVLNSATEQTQLDEAVTTLNSAIEAFENSPDKEAQLNKTELDAKIKYAEKISQGKKSEDAFKTLKAAIEVAKNVLNSANEQTQLDDALANLNKAIEAFSNSADVNVTPGASEKVYTIPVKLMHSAEDKESMGNKALISPAKVSINGDDVSIDLTFQGIEVPLGTTKFYGHLTNLFSFKDNTIRGEAIPAEVLEQMEDKAMDGSQKQFPKVFRIKLTKSEFDNLTDNTLYVKVWVDAMDGLAGGTPGAGAQNARLVFDKANMTDVTPGGETPTPPTPPTPNLGNKDKLIDALRSYSNLGGSQYTYDSNMKYVNAYNSAMALLSRDNVTDSDINSAISNLKSAAAGLTLDTSKSNNSGNNQGWGNNNQGWGNNNQGWGNNNQGWGNNNRGWGNNNSGFGNNNSAWNNQNNKQNNGPVTIQYEVPVEVLHAHQSGYSMANAAINHTARVEERDGKFRYTVNFHAIQRDFGGKTLTGNLTNLFIIDGNKYRADQSGNTWSWVMNGKYDRVNVAVWVDAMDEIAGKGPGGGEQNAILSFNWNAAREVGRVGGNNNQNQQNQNQQKQQNQQNQQNQNQQAVQNNNTNNFTDTSGHWAKAAIDYVVSKGYFAGLSKTEFGPNKSITRGQFVSVLGRMLNVNVNDYKDQNFKDVKSGMYYSPYITWANKVGIVSGVGQGNFAPDKALTREEMAVMMTKFLKVSGKNLNAKGNTNAFKDEDKIQGWAKDSVKEMARLGIVSGMGDGSFAPKSPFTRAQVAQVLYNIDHN